MHEFRDFNDKTYKAWRLRVYKRDGFRCKMCGGNNKLQAHHIKRWADYPTLRYVVSNGITLCELCHTLVKDKEEAYEAQFILMVKQIPYNRKTAKQKQKETNDTINIKLAMRKKDEKIQGD